MPKACLEMEGVEFFKVDAKAAMLFCTGPIRQGASTCLCVAMKRSVYGSFSHLILPYTKQV